MKRSPQRPYLLIIILVAILLRLAISFYLGDTVPNNTDETSYSALGERLAAGHGYTFDRGWYPFTPPETPTAHWSFLYSAFVAVVYRVFGVHPLAARIAGAVLGGILLPWTVYHLSRRLFVEPRSAPLSSRSLSTSQSLSLLAALLAAVYFLFVRYGASLMTETFYIVALLWTLERGLALQQYVRGGAGSPRRWLGIGAGLGVALAIATLLRQSVLPWALVMGLWLLWRGWKHRSVGFAFRALALAALIVMGAVLPFTIRNYIAYDDFLLLNSNAGYAMYSAQHPMHGVSFKEYEAAPIPTELNDLNEAQLDKQLMRRGFGFILDDPGRYALLSLSRVPDYFEFWPTRDTSLINNLGRVLSIGVLLPFMIYGVWLAVRNPVSSPGHTLLHAEDVAFLVLFMAFYALLHILTWAMSRYRLPVDAVALPFAALALLDLAQRVRLVPTPASSASRSASP